MTTSNEHNNAPAVPQGDEHAAFKSAMKAEYGLLKFDLTRSQGGGYQSLTTHAAYQGWKVARAASPAPAQGEPFGHFRAEPFGWTECAEDDEGAIALYERPQEVGLTDDEIVSAFCSAYRNFPSTAIALTHTVLKDGIDIDKLSAPTMAFARAIIAALRAKGGK